MKIGLLVCVLILSLIAGPVLAKNDKEGKSGTLPPGLQKKVETGKPLPPGWEKKLAKGDILDEDIYARGRVVAPLGKDGTISVEVEGKIFKLYNNTREIIEILK